MKSILELFSEINLEWHSYKLKPCASPIRYVRKPPDTKNWPKEVQELLKKKGKKRGTKK